MSEIHTGSIPKKLYEKLREKGVVKVILQFSGGYDEGHLYVDLVYEEDREKDHSLDTAVEEWAWEVNCYTGAGDGTGSFGDNITFDLINKTVETEEWYHSVKYEEKEESTFELEEA